MLCIGHRGARGHAPENTLKSINAGIALGADMIEVDIQRLGEQLLILHDLRLERTAASYGRLLSHDFDTVRTLDAGDGERIPTLAEALACVHGRAEINLEIKSADGTGILLAQHLHQHQRNGEIDLAQVLVSSFDHHELLAFHRHCPEVRIGALYCGVPLDWAAGAERLNAWSVNLSHEFTPRGFVEDAHRRGMKVLVYTVNEPEEIKHFAALGVDGLFSDFPERVVEQRARGE